MLSALDDASVMETEMLAEHVANLDGIVGNPESRGGRNEPSNFTTTTKDQAGIVQGKNIYCFKNSSNATKFHHLVLIDATMSRRAGLTGMLSLPAKHKTLEVSRCVPHLRYSPDFLSLVGNR